MRKPFFTTFLLSLFFSCTDNSKNENRTKEDQKGREEQSIEEKMPACIVSPVEFENIVRKEARVQKIEFALAKSVYMIESRFDASFVSSTGAVGVMQLMPKKGSYITTNYENYRAAQHKKGFVYKGLSKEAWINFYMDDVIKLKKEYMGHDDYCGLIKKDKRFDANWNIAEGVRELAFDFHHFSKKGHSLDNSVQFAFAAYQAGIPAVEKGTDHIPKNGDTEHYVKICFGFYKINRNAQK